ncbi:unnamed protein product [Lactuca virosa]|uniref:Uncharacterized protein n=1 Tax=Lactuca virosa TaxID=75947 RepID=A0AAU9P0Y6_9ASTR|nr:unnamed protein product [Lactuca virosa]
MDNQSWPTYCTLTNYQGNLACKLYNVTEDEYGRPLKPNYVVGLLCCYDGTQCKVKNGVESVKRNLYLKYTVEWFDWSDSIIPVNIYLMSQILGRTLESMVACENGSATNDFTNIKKSKASFLISGDVVYGVAHLHSGGIGYALYGGDGRVIFSSRAIYGEGNEAGNEVGYIVGMTTCYPNPGSIKITKDEVLNLESNYNSEKSHTGVIGLFYIIVADSSSTLDASVQIHQDYVVPIPIFFWRVAVFGLAIFAALVVSYRRQRQSEDDYHSIATST